MERLQTPPAVSLSSVGLHPRSRDARPVARQRVCALACATLTLGCGSASQPSLGEPTSLSQLGEPVVAVLEPDLDLVFLGTRVRLTQCEIPERATELTWRFERHPESFARSRSLGLLDESDIELSRLEIFGAVFTATLTRFQGQQHPSGCDWSLRDIARSGHERAADIVIAVEHVDETISVGLHQTIAIVPPEPTLTWQLSLEPSTLKVLTPPPTLSAPGPNGWLLLAVGVGELDVVLTSASPSGPVMRLVFSIAVTEEASNAPR